METGESDIPLGPPGLLLSIHLLPLWVRGILWHVQIQNVCEYVFSTCNSWSDHTGIRLVTGGMNHKKSQSFTITIIFWHAANSSLYQRSLMGMVATNGPLKPKLIRGNLTKNRDTQRVWCSFLVLCFDHTLRRCLLSQSIWVPHAFRGRSFAVTVCRPFCDQRF